jgi:hypothetical protein
VIGAGGAPVLGVPESTPASRPFSLTIHQIDGDPTRGLLPVRRSDIRAELPGPGLAILLRDMTRDEDQIAAADERDKGCDRGRNARERNGQGVELFVDGHFFLLRVSHRQVVAVVEPHAAGT